MVIVVILKEIRPKKLNLFSKKCIADSIYNNEKSELKKRLNCTDQNKRLSGR